MTICTIIAKNYLPAARVLSRSFSQHHPDGRCYVLVLDPDRDYFDPATEPFTTVTVDQLNLLASKESLSFQYSVTELATAVKASFLRHLLEEKNEASVIYLDPDILITAPLSALAERLHKSSGIVVTPHLDQDYPDDRLMPDDSWILRYGVVNLGFLGVTNSSEATSFLRWLEHKLRDKCLMEPERGYFLDQRFFDLALTLFPFIELEHNVGYNVAYWNLHSRRLTQDNDGQWLCNGQPLIFFHFSGYNADRPADISKYMTRYRLPDRPDLQPLFADYRARLLENGYESCKAWPYGYDRFASGRLISGRAREIYRENPSRYTEPFSSTALERAAVIADHVGNAAHSARLAASQAKRWLHSHLP